MRWTVEYLTGEVEAELQALPLDMRAEFLRIVQLIESKGLDRVREPYVKRIEGKLWEMRRQAGTASRGRSTSPPADAGWWWSGCSSRRPRRPRPARSGWR